MSMRSNKSGPIIFGGNSLLRKTEKQEENSSEILSKAQYHNPVNKSKNVKDLDFDDQYAAWGW